MTEPELRRTIRRSRLTSGTEVAALVQTVLLAELFEPSRCMWIVSPWISDIPILDNATLGFGGLSDEWGPRRVRLSEVLVARAKTGAALVVATRLMDERNQNFAAAMHATFAEAWLDDADALRLVDDELLHEKGIAGDDFYLAGSMNLTWTGVHIASEVVTWSLAPSEVHGARRSFFERYGGVFAREAG
jgi:hypothetical protein